MATDTTSTSRIDAQRKSDSRFVLAFAGTGLLVTLLAFALASTPTAVAVLLVSAAGAYGAKRGAAATAALVLGLLLGALLGIPLGKVFEDSIGGALGLSGLAKRGASIGVVALVVLVAVSTVGGVAARRVMRSRPGLARVDRPLGALLGGIEGVLLSLFMMWGVLVIQPVAQSRLEGIGEHHAEPAAGTLPALSQSLASGVVAFAEEIESSAAGRVAMSTNPMEEAPVFALAEDFLAVARDAQAMAMFVESDAVRRMQEHPAVLKAMEILKSDPEIRLVIERGLDQDGLRSIFQSDTVLRALDETDVAEELAPLADELHRALEEAKASIRQ